MQFNLAIDFPCPPIENRVDSPVEVLPPDGALPILRITLAIPLEVRRADLPVLDLAERLVRVGRIPRAIPAVWALYCHLWSPIQLNAFTLLVRLVCRESKRPLSSHDLTATPSSQTSTFEAAASTLHLTAFRQWA